jgi:hypothetical protein
MTQMKIDNDATRRLKAEVRRKLPFLVEFGNEDDILAYAKTWNPQITEDELKRVVRLFRAAKLARAHPPQSC